MPPLPLYDTYLKYLKTQDFSPETLYNYERDLMVFARFLTDEARIPFDKISKKTLELYKAYLSSRDRKTATGAVHSDQLSASSLNRNLSSVRRYLNYLIDMDYEVPVPPEAIKLTKMPHTHPRVAELPALVRLIESPIDFEKIPEVGMRNRAILETLFATGMRISELTSLNRDQIDATGRIFIRGKGRKERFAYLTDRAQECIKKYIAMRTDISPALFIPYRGRNMHSTRARLSTNYIQRCESCRHPGASGA